MATNSFDGENNENTKQDPIQPASQESTQTMCCKYMCKPENEPIKANKILVLGMLLFLTVS